MITKEFAMERYPGRWVCPACDGGQSHEGSCNIWDEGGYRHVKCHRASCGAYARYPLIPYPEDKTAPTPLAEALHPYAGAIWSILAGDRAEWLRRYEFIPEGLATGSGGHWVLPILAPDGSRRGIMELSLAPKHRKIWKAKHEPMISWTPEGDFYDGVYLVEDQISAAKLHVASSIRAVALLGTSLNAQSAAEIQKHANHVTIALDADATAKAFMLARKWGAAFKSCRVQILTRDIKDMPFRDIREMTRNAGHGDFGSLSEF